MPEVSEVLNWVDPKVYMPLKATRIWLKREVWMMYVVAVTLKSFRRAPVMTAPAGSAGTAKVLRSEKLVPSQAKFDPGKLPWKATLFVGQVPVASASPGARAPLAHMAAVPLTTDTGAAQCPTEIQGRLFCDEPVMKVVVAQGVLLLSARLVLEPRKLSPVVHAVSALLV